MYCCACGHGLMSRPSRPETVAVIGERPVPLLLQNLHHRLLDKPIQHRRDAKLAHPSVRLGDFHPPHRLRLIGPAQQLFPDGWPVLFQIVRQVHRRSSRRLPALPLLALTRRNASFRFSAHILPPSVDRYLAGLSVPLVAADDSVSSLPASRASPVSAVEKSSSIWIFCRLSFLRFTTYLPLLLVRAFGHRFRLRPIRCSAFRLRSASLALPTSWPTMPSADFCSAVRAAFRRPQSPKRHRADLPR